MNADSRAPPTPLRRFYRTPLQYSLLVTSVLSAKLLHLYSHVTSIPVLLYLLYMPTFLALDILNALLFWIIVHLTIHGRAWILLAFARCLFCFVILGASSAQIAFFMETGAEIKWGAAKNLASDPDGFKVALSGAVQATFVSIFIIVVAWIISQPLYNGTQYVLSLGLKAFLPRHCPAPRSKEADVDTSSEDLESRRGSCGNFISASSRNSVEAEPLLAGTQESQESTCWVARIMFLAPIFGISVLLYVRPPHFPYGHMSNSIPYTLMDIWNPFDGDMCQAGYLNDFPDFPIDSLVSEEFWEPPKGRFPGWKPAANMTVLYQREHHIHRPTWLPKQQVQGLERWYSPREEFVEVTSEGKTYHPPHPPPHHNTGFDPGGPPPPPRKHRHGHGRGVNGFEGLNYDPVTDPLRISNTDQAVFAPILEALRERDIEIKHIFFLALESTRKDVFPFKKNSHLHQQILDSHNTEEGAAKASTALSKLSVNSEIISGEASGFEPETRQLAGLNGTWRSLSRDRGGINVQGALTGSTTSLKSFLESHCGVQPLAVDFTVEVNHEIYQPCIPSILKLLSSRKKSSAALSKRKRHSNFTSMPWNSVYVQAITDQFDHQDELNQEVGFDQVIVKNTLMDPKSKHFPPNETQSNYFGFPETQVKPYIEDTIRQAEEKGERLFLSHLTSTTHHPWSLPEAAGKSTQYLEQNSWRKEHELNRYLNTIKYIDNWIGEIMDLLENTGVANQTLVIFVGDHGMAFEEDSPIHSTFENGHISNMRVPLNFYHPSLPRIQLQVNATSLSIIPTVLDLLVTTNSLDKEDSNIASDLIQQYEGQSLIRPYKVKKNGRQAWNIAVLNAGGAFLSISSAAVPYRLVIPICKAGVYRFTSNDLDPDEIRPIEANSIKELQARVKYYYGDEASAWIEPAEKIGKWWVLEQRRRWRYNGASLQDDRRPEELTGAGAEKKEHWWDTRR